MKRKRHSPSARVEALESRVLRHAGLAGSGLLGQYFNNKDFSDLKLTRTDATVNFAWATASPDSSIAPDTFSVRWTGKIIPHKSEAYTFYTSTDDGVRLWIDGNLVIDKFVNQATTQWASAPIALTAGEPVDVRLDYFENTGGATAKLFWASATTAKAIIPQGHLLPPDPSSPPSPPPPPPPPPPPSVQAPFFGTPLVIGDDGATTLQAEDFDTGGEGVAYHDVDVSNRGGKYRLSDRVDIETTTDAGGGYDVGWTSGGEWLEYSIDIATAGPRNMQFRVASTAAGGRFHVEVDGVNVTGALAVPNTDGWQKFTTISTTTSDLPAGQHIMRLVMDVASSNGNIGNFNWFTFAPPGPPSPPPPPPPPSPPPPPPPPPSSAIRIDAARSSNYTTADGKVWSKDVYYSGGLLSLGGFNIAGTTDDTFYATRRFGNSFSYAIPVAAPGDYQVTLYFADESYAAGGRVFNVSVEGKVVLDHFDIVAKVGKGVATSETFIASVTDGKLNLAFTGVKNNATLSAIEVAPTGVVQPDISWRAVAPSPVARAEGGGTVAGGKVYAFGGYHSLPGVIAAQRRTDVYDPATNRWTRLDDMPEPLTHVGVAVDGATIWLVGGYVGDHPGPATAHVWKYDTSTDTWTRGPDLPQAQGAGAAAILDRTLHFFGGNDSTRTIELGAHWSLDLDDESAGWTGRADMPNPRNHIAGAAIGGMIYAIGGQHGEQETQVAQAEVDRYDPQTDTWTTVAALPQPRSHIGAGTFVMNGKIIVVGGEIAYETQRDTVLAYDPETNKWSLLGILPQPRSTTIAGALSATELILTCGNGPFEESETWIGTLVGVSEE